MAYITVSPTKIGLSISDVLQQQYWPNLLKHPVEKFDKLSCFRCGNFLENDLAVMFCIYMFSRETCPFLSEWVRKLQKQRRPNCLSYKTYFQMWCFQWWWWQWWYHWWCWQWWWTVMIVIDVSWSFNFFKPTSYVLICVPKMYSLESKL